MVTPPSPLISLAEAARLLDVSTDTVRRMIARGELQAVRVGLRKIKLRVTDVEAAARPILPTEEGQS